MTDEMNETVSQAQFNPGDVVTGLVDKIDDKKVTVKLEDATEAIIQIRELSPIHIQHPSEIVQEGDTVTAVVIKRDEATSSLILSKRRAQADSAWETMAGYYETGATFDVTVQDVVKGGLVTDVGVRGFIPASLVDIQFIEDLSVFKGQTLSVKVHELDIANNKLILSRKAVLEEQQRSEVQQTLSELREGDTVPGTVRRLASFGAFVEVLPGVDGLVHISELSWQHVEEPSDVVQIGDSVDVKVLRVDPLAGKISLSLKQAGKSPWAQSLEHVQVGDELKGTVKRVMDYGAFVEVAPGIEGLVHVSQMADHHVESPHDELAVNDTVTVRVLSFDFDRRRVSLSMKNDAGRSVPARKPRQTQSRERFPQQDNTTGTGATLGDLFGDLFKN